LIAALGLGDLAGAAAAPSVARRLAGTQTLTGGMALMSVGLALTALAGSYALCLLGVLIAGFGDGLGLVAEEGILQRSVPDALLGRVAAAYEATLTLASVAALAPAGLLVASLGPHPAYAAAAVICAVATLAVSKCRQATTIAITPVTATVPV